MAHDIADQRIDGVYQARSKSELVEKYNSWAETYDADMQSVGYVHIAVMAGLISRYVSNRNSKILDAGVGTGSLGGLLAILGYSNLHGIDMSDGMLAIARNRNVYTDLHNRTLGEPLGLADNSIAAIVSSGTFTTGHAPASAFDELLRITQPGGHLIFTVGTKVWEEQGFAARFAYYLSKDLVREIETTPIYHPMPLSPLEKTFTTRAHVYQKL